MSLPCLGPVDRTSSGLGGKVRARVFVAKFGTELPSISPEVVGYSFGIAASYGTFVLLSHHYSDERRFQRVRSKIREFTHNKLQKAKWKSVSDVRQSHPPLLPNPG